MEEDEQDGMEGRLEEDGGESSGQLTSSRMANVSGAEVTHMCVSVLTEGSSLRYDSSMQVGWCPCPSVLVQGQRLTPTVSRWTVATAPRQRAPPAWTQTVTSKTPQTWLKKLLRFDT